MLRFDGEPRVGVAATGASATRLTLAAGFDDGGWFSASEDWGDWDGEMAACRADGAGEMTLPGVEGGFAKCLALGGGDVATSCTIGDDCGSSKDTTGGLMFLTRSAAYSSTSSLTAFVSSID